METALDESQATEGNIPPNAEEAIDVFASSIQQLGINTPDVDSLNDVFLTERHAHIMSFPLINRGEPLDPAKIALLQTTTDKLIQVLEANRGINQARVVLWLKQVLYHKEVLQCLIDGNRQKLRQLLTRGSTGSASRLAEKLLSFVHGTRP